MPRHRKYDYENDYPIKLFVKIKVGIVNDMEELGYDQKHMETELSKIAEKYFSEFVEKHRKKD